MTTSDKKPRRTTKSAKTAKTTDTNDIAAPTASAIPTLSDPVGGAERRAPSNGGTLAAGTVPAGTLPPGARSAAKPNETRRIKAVNVSVTSHNREDRHASIARAAYFLSESRGFEPGHEVEDWLAAEAEVDQRLLREGRAS
jgi:hypothetical protein